MDLRVMQGDILEQLAALAQEIESGKTAPFHAALGDPPYALDFMGMGWDSYTPTAFQAWVKDWSSLLNKCLLPGALNLQFGGTRTYHRLASGLEDAGFEIGDCIFAWVYGQGFPKGGMVDKKIDKAAGAQREVIGAGKYADRGAGIGEYFADKATPIEARLYETAPATQEAQLWQGYSTTLKPAVEPIVVSRAARAGKSFTQCALDYGTAHLNIDGTRIETDENLNGGAYTGNARADNDYRLKNGLGTFNQPGGRWTPNTSFSHLPECTAEACADGCHVASLNQQSGFSSENRQTRPLYRELGKRAIYGTFGIDNDYEPTVYQGAGYASRFYYTPKAAVWEREAGIINGSTLPDIYGQGLNTATKVRTDEQAQEGVSRKGRKNPHKTVKPIRLIEYYARLILPPVPATRLLIPFGGVFSEVIGAMLGGWAHVTTIEREALYCAVGQERFVWWSQFENYEQAQSHYKKHGDAIHKRLF